MLRITTALVIVLTALALPGLALAHHRDNYLPELGSCTDESMVSLSADDQLEVFDCLIGGVRDNRDLALFSANQELGAGAFVRARELADCGPGLRPCGHSWTKAYRDSGYLDSCSQVQESYLIDENKDNSPRQTISILLHGARSQRPLVSNDLDDLELGYWEQDNKRYWVFAYGSNICPDPDGEGGGDLARVANVKGWCGPLRSHDDTIHETHRKQGRPKFHVVYLAPKNSPWARFPQVASLIQYQVLNASNWMAQKRGYAIRLDMGTRCGPRNVDISTMRSQATAGQLSSKDRLKWLRIDLLKHDFHIDNRTRFKYLFIIDGLWETPLGRSSCGGSFTGDDPRPQISENVYAKGGDVNWVAVEKGGSLCGDWGAILHEQLHSLGAVVSSAPNHYRNGHCNDAWDDVMCNGYIDYSLGKDRGRKHFNDMFIDWRRDDYFATRRRRPYMNWWTADRNPWLCTMRACNYY